MEKITIQFFKFKNNLLSCQYCDKIMHKSQISKFFYCKCNVYSLQKGINKYIFKVI